MVQLALIALALLGLALVLLGVMGVFPPSDFTRLRWRGDLDSWLSVGLFVGGSVLMGLAIRTSIRRRSRTPPAGP